MCIIIRFFSTFGCSDVVFDDTGWVEPGWLWTVVAFGLSVSFGASTLDGSFVSGCLDVVFDGLLSFDVSLGDSLLAGSSDGLVLSGFSTSLDYCLMVALELIH